MKNKVAKYISHVEEHNTVMKTIRQRKVAGARFEHESRFLSRWRNSKQCITEINFFVTKFAELILLQFRGTVLVTIFFFT